MRPDEELKLAAAWGSPAVWMSPVRTGKGFPNSRLGRAVIRRPV